MVRRSTAGEPDDAAGVTGPETTLPFRLERFKEVLSEASHVVGEYFRHGARVAHKPDGSPITEADTAANEYLQAALRPLCPRAAWISEESSEGLSLSIPDWLWVVDPLDGTKEFASGIPEFAISVGLVHQGRVVMGGVVNPATNEGAIGGIGLGVDSWGCVTRRSRADSLASARASVSRTEIEDGTGLPYLDLVGTAVVLGSVAYKLLRVAVGSEDLTFSVQHKSVWDVCGGIALVHAAGGVYRRFDGQSTAFDVTNTRIRSGAAAGDTALVDAFVVNARMVGGEQLQ